MNKFKNNNNMNNPRITTKNLSGEYGFSQQFELRRDYDDSDKWNKDKTIPLKDQFHLEVLKNGIVVETFNDQTTAEFFLWAFSKFPEKFKKMKKEINSRK